LISLVSLSGEEIYPVVMRQIDSPRSLALLKDRSYQYVIGEKESSICHFITIDLLVCRKGEE
jgi:hypothetical protein